MNVEVNQFPTLTWNFLNINRTKFESDVSAVVRGTVTGLSDKIILTEVESCEKIETGLGQKFDDALDSVEKKCGAKIAQFEVPANVALSNNVLINFDVTDKSSSFSDYIIKAGEGSVSNFIFIFNSSESEAVFGNRLRVFAEENSVVHVGIVNLAGDKVVSFSTIGSVVKDNAVIDVTEIELGGAKTYSGVFNSLDGYKSKYTGHTAYVVNGNRFLDMNQVSHQTGRCTESSFSTDGVVCDNGSKTWRGTINFKRGCVDSKGDEQENVLLLNPDVVNKSLPVILCDEEEVEGRHGCSIGKLDMEKLFYMQSRGVDFKTAQELMVRAKVNAASRYLNDEEVCGRISATLDSLF